MDGWTSNLGVGHDTRLRNNAPQFDRLGGRVLYSIIQAAGWPIWPLIACSIVAMALIIERFMALQNRKIAPPTLVDEAIAVSRNGPPPPDVTAKLAANSLLGEVLASGLRVKTLNAQVPEAKLREAFEAAGRLAAHQLEKYLNALATIASAAPLLGLLGTVIGMIEIFAAQTPGGTNPQQIAYGISVALYNTAFGLMVAIPALLFHRYFRSRVDTYLLTLETSAARFAAHLNGLAK